MNFEQYELDDFLMDESFQNWVKEPNGEERRFWEAWLNDHPEKISEAERARKVIKSLSFKNKGYTKQEITELWSNIKSNTVGRKPHNLGQKAKFIGVVPWNYLKVAAVILPFVIAAVLFLFFRDIPAQEQVITRHFVEKLNPKGQKLTVFLSDGSKVKLNAESKISYLKPFNEELRVVQLEGEAFFEVAHDKNRPFIVRSGNLETRVLGTSFNVEAYPDENKIKVAVKTGKVSIENKNQNLEDPRNKSIVLSPLEMATYSVGTNETVVSGFDPNEILGWSEGTLYFNGASMEEFVAKLERWYGIDIIVEREESIKKGIVGEFRDQSLEEILMGTHEASEFEYEFKNGNVIIK